MLGSVGELGEDRARDIGDDERDRAAARGAQRPTGMVRHIVELPCRVEHSLTGRFRDPDCRVAREHPRGCCRGHPGEGGNIGELDHNCACLLQMHDLI